MITTPERRTLLIIGLACIAAAIILLFAAVQLAGADSGPLPYKVRMVGTLSGVNCYGPTCCGQVTTIIDHTYYSTFVDYCRWWPHTLSNGQRVTATMYRTQRRIW